MSDLMLLGVLRMQMSDDPDPMTLRQFVSRARQAACRIEADADELAELRAELAELRRDAKRYRWLLDKKRLYLGPVVGARKDNKGQRHILSAITIGSAPHDTETLDAAIDAAMTRETR